jgi:hypothetical protein
MSSQGGYSLLKNTCRGDKKMWSAIIASVVTIGAVLYMEGPIVALALTALSSVALLVVLRASEAEQKADKPQPRPATTVGTNDDIDLMFPPLRRRAS